MVADFICDVFPSSSGNNAPISKIKKPSCSLLYLLTVGVVKKILRPRLNPMVTFFGPVLYFFYCLSWYLLMSCNKTNTDRRFVQYEFYMTSKKFILSSASPRAVWIFPLSYEIPIALITGPYLYDVLWWRLIVDFFKKAYCVWRVEMHYHVNTFEISISIY